MKEDLRRATEKLSELRKRRDALILAESMAGGHKEGATTEDKEWEDEKKQLLKKWGEEVAALIFAFQRDKSLWDSQREALTRTMADLKRRGNS